MPLCRCYEIPHMRRRYSFPLLPIVHRAPPVLNYPRAPSISVRGGVRTPQTRDVLANMASWKCGAYVVVGTIVIVLIILLNFDYLPKRRLSEELELTTKSSYKGFAVSTGRPTTLKLSTETLTERTTSNSAVAKVRPLKFHAK